MRTLWLKKSLLQFFITSALLLSLSAYGWFLGDLLKNGYDLSLQFLFQNPADAGRTGGIFSILSSTLILIGLSLLFVIPFGLGTALYLHTHPTPTIITSLNLLAATPSIIFGLFGNAFFVYQLHMGYSLLAGALTLTIMVLPLFVHTSLEALKNVPSSYVEAGVSCGLSPFSVLTQVTLRCATPGILMALALSLGRALSETAAL
ncbi:MAG: ABC transporter permease subunit, partial [Bdellovibrio sp.]